MKTSSKAASHKVSVADVTSLKIQRRRDEELKSKFRELTSKATPRFDWQWCSSDEEISNWDMWKLIHLCFFVFWTNLFLLDSQLWQHVERPFRKNDCSHGGFFPFFPMILHNQASICKMGECHQSARRWNCLSFSAKTQQREKIHNVNWILGHCKCTHTYRQSTKSS